MACIDAWVTDEAGVVADAAVEDVRVHGEVLRSHGWHRRSRRGQGRPCCLLLPCWCLLAHPTAQTWCHQHLLDSFNPFGAEPEAKCCGRAFLWSIARCMYGLSSDSPVPKVKVDSRPSSRSLR